MSPFIIYALHHLESLHVYVGKSSSGLKRPRRHAAPASWRAYSNAPVTRWVERRLSLGQVYEITILEELSSAAELDEAERFYIAYFKFIGMSLLNITEGGGGFQGGKHTEATRTLISRLHKGRALTPEHRASISTALMNRTVEERASAAAKVSAALKGKKRTPEQRAKASAARKGKSLSQRALIRAVEVQRAQGFPGLRRGSAGRVLSEETRKKISESLKGKRLSQDAYDRGAENRRGRKSSDESNAKRSASLKGRTFSPETIAKMSEAQKRRAPPSEETREKLAVAQRRRYDRELATIRPKIRLNMFKNYI